MTQHEPTNRRPNDITRAQDSATVDAVEKQVVKFAEQLGRMVGTVEARAEGWLDRQALHDQLTRIRDTAEELLKHLARGASAVEGEASRRRHEVPEGRTAAPQATNAGAETATKRDKGRSGGVVDAPGKRHRKPPPSAHGAKHSDEKIPKLRAAREMRQRRRG